MLHFHAERRTKYSLEALVLQFQLASLPPDLVHQLTWGRFVNTHGGPGRNIPCDLHNEHINRLFKEMVGNMGANFTPESSTRAARSVTTLEKMSKKFDHETGIHPELSAHSQSPTKMTLTVLWKCCNKLNHTRFKKDDVTESSQKCQAILLRLWIERNFICG